MPFTGSVISVFLHTIPSLYNPETYLATCVTASLSGSTSHIKSSICSNLSYLPPKSAFQSSFSVMYFWCHGSYHVATNRRTTVLVFSESTF